MSGPESELQKPLKGIQWQNGNCLSCIWFATKDPLNADLVDRAKCIQPKLKIYELVVSGRDWCNLYEEIKQKQIEHKQELALKAEEKSGQTKPYVTDANRDNYALDTCAGPTHDTLVST